MTLPGALPRALPRVEQGVTAWRLDRARHAATWDSGEGARLFGGRWNSKGFAAVYTSLDPATAILEVAVHKGFEILDLDPHVMSAVFWPSVERIRIVPEAEIPDPAWLRPDVVSAAQQAFGDALLTDHGAVVLPSVVCRWSWNLVFRPAGPGDRTYRLSGQEPFVLDPRLAPAKP